MDSLLSVSAAASLPLPASPVPGAVRIQGLAHIDLQQLPNVCIRQKSFIARRS